METYEIQTERLGLRRWTDSDVVPFADMNRDPKVMQYFPKPLTKAESETFIRGIREHFTTYDYGLWAVELREKRRFIGFIGFKTATFEADFTPCTEIGWRLASPFWGRGYATEGAKACLSYGFNVLGFSEVFSFTAKINRRSYRVMEKIGMKKIGEFMHPDVENHHPLQRHVLYHISRTEGKMQEVLW